MLWNIDKVLERLMHDFLYNFLEINSVIYELQFGFRQKHFKIVCFSSFNWQNETANRQWKFSFWNICWSPESLWQIGYDILCFPIWNIFIMVSLKVLFWDHYYLWFASMILIAQIRYCSIHCFADDTKLTKNLKI